MTTVGAVVFTPPGTEPLSRCLESIRWMDAVRVCALGNPKEQESEIGTDWVLHLWGQEVVGAELSRSLSEISQRPLDGSPLFYRVSVRSYLLGRWVDGSPWGLTPAPRLYRQMMGPPGGWWEESQLPSPKPGLLGGWIEDYSCVPLRRGVDAVNCLSSLWAERLQERGYRLRGTSVVTYPLSIFARYLLFRGLACRGLAGVSLAALAAYAALATAMKYWEAVQVGSA